jgi:hypothetical protein
MTKLKGPKHICLHSTFTNCSTCANASYGIRSILPIFKQLHPNEPISFHHLQKMQNGQWGMCCSLSPISYGFVNGPLVTTQEKIRLIIIKRRGNITIQTM